MKGKTDSELNFVGNYQEIDKLTFSYIPKWRGCFRKYEETETYKRLK